MTGLEWRESNRYREYFQERRDIASTFTTLIPKLGILGMHEFESAARPVIFEQDEANYPYWGKGSSFLVANSKHYFWVTAGHVIERLGGSADALRIFPSDNSRISLPFNEKYTLKTEGLDDEEYKDLYVLRIALSEFEEFGDAPLIAQDADVGLMPAEELAPNDELWIVGYPAESTSINFETGTIRQTRSVIRAVYLGHSVSDYCHSARVETTICLSSYDGLSGSPVFFLQSMKVCGNDVLLPLLVGMLLRGTAESSLVHFLSARVVKRLIDLASIDS